MAQALDPLWRLRRHTSLRWRDWGGDSVVFDVRSGHTHRFSPLPAAVLAYLEEGPRTPAALVHQVAADLDTAPDVELHAAVSASLERLAAIGWAEAA